MAAAEEERTARPKGGECEAKAFPSIDNPLRVLWRENNNRTTIEQQSKRKEERTRTFARACVCVRACARACARERERGSGTPLRSALLRSLTSSSASGILRTSVQLASSAARTPIRFAPSASVHDAQHAPWWRSTCQQR